MSKLTNSDLLAILRRFNIASDAHFARQIEHIKRTPLSPSAILASLRFEHRRYYVLLDNASEDDPDTILDKIKTNAKEPAGELLLNPHEPSDTYALSFKGKEAHLFAATPRHSRLDATLAKRYPDISRSTWQKYIKNGHVKVDGKTQTSVKFSVSDTDDIALDLPEAQDYSEHTLPIIYLDDNVIVINKPAGILTHSKGALHDEFTVADFFKKYTDVGLDTNRPGIIHRLDRDTSGVLIGARNNDVATLLKHQFADRKVKKTYLAVTKGVLSAPHAKIELPIGRNPAAPSTFRVDAKGKPAVTTYTVLATNQQGESLVELSPTTGRTHQLRVHMAYLSAPILGDRIYGQATDRLYLHAFRLEVTLPRGERHTFEAPVPAEFLERFPDFRL